MIRPRTLMLACSFMAYSPCFSITQKPLAPVVQQAHLKEQTPLSHQPVNNDLIAFSSFAQLVMGIGQLVCQQDCESTTHGIQNVTSAALNFYHLINKCGLSGKESPETIAQTLVDQLDPTTRRDLSEQIGRAFAEIRLVLVKHMTCAKE